MSSERGLIPLLLVVVVGLVAVAVVGLTVVIKSRDDPPPDEGSGEYEVRAIGDSVTAAWGHYPGDRGEEVPVTEIAACVPPATPNGLCQSPRTVAYPAVFAKERGIPRARPGFENLAIAGADPVDWLPGGPFADRLDRVVADDPDLTVLTLGANPLLIRFLFPNHSEGGACVRKDDEEEIRRCVQASLAKFMVVDRLTRVYTRLLATDEEGKQGLVVVFQYHETVPITLRGTRVDILFELLGGAISTAVERAREQRPEDADRLLLIEPPSFAGHDCEADDRWVLINDSCIHPSAAGHRAYARALDEAVPEPGS